MQNWDNLRLFLALHRSGSLRAAAQVLGVNHSTVSRRLNRLNQDYGTPLLDKTPLGYDITEAGKSLLNAAISVEQTIHDSVQKLNAFDHKMSGKIRLSVPEALASHLVLDDLLTFQKMHPSIELDLSATYEFADLNKMEADIVIRGCDTPPDHLIGRRIATINLCAYAACHYLSHTPDFEQCWILANREQTREQWFLTSGHADIPVGLIIDNFHLRYQALLNSKGLVRAPCYIADKDPRVARLPNAKVSPLFDLWVLTHKNLVDIPRVRLMMDFLYGVLTKHRSLFQGTTQ